MVTVRLTDAEAETIAARAAAAGISRQRLLVEAATAPPPLVTAGGLGYGMTRSERNAVLAELFAARRLALAVSNNLNQLARAANATGRVPLELPAAADAARRAADRLQTAAEELRPPRRRHG